MRSNILVFGFLALLFVLWIWLSWLDINKSQKQYSKENIYNIRSTLQPVYYKRSETNNEDRGGYDAGYEWAANEDIDDTSYCSGGSSSFNEGCTDFVEEMAEIDPEGYSY
jgi:hypothetical protein